MTLGAVEATPTVRGIGRFGYQPALDGLRALALVGVIGYHAGIDTMRGGFLGVSAFFTLSGFLITTLLLQERQRTGRIALGAFWARRARRLLPALFLTVGMVALTAPFWADPSQRSRLGADGLASLSYVANWWFIVEGDSYGALFQSPSPLRHIWTLAVEEQYYLLFPLFFGALLAATRVRRRALVAVMGVVTASLAALPAFLLAGGASVDRLYFGTDTRIAEIFVGAFLAVLWSAAGSKAPRSSPALTIAGATAMGVLAWMWTVSSPHDAWLYRGGLAAHAVAVCVVIVAALGDGGPIRQLLSHPFLVRLGVLSYGAYLIHWPLMVWLEQDTELGPPGRFLVALGIVLPAAALSFRFVEQPVRGLSPARRRWTWALLPAGAVTALLVVGVASRAPDDPTDIDFAAASAEFDRLTGAGVAPPPSDEPRPSPAARRFLAAVPQEAPPAEALVLAETVIAPPRVGVFGDSTALMTGLGLSGWADDAGRMVSGGGEPELGCGILAVEARVIQGRTDAEVDCPDPLETWPAKAIAGDLDVAVIQIGAWEVVDQQLEEGGPFLALGRDPELETAVVDRLTELADRLLGTVELVVFLANPAPGQPRIDRFGPPTETPENDPGRWQIIRAIEERVAETDDRIAVVGLDEWLIDGGEDARLRPDGLHFTWATSFEVATDWLGPTIVEAWESGQR